MTDPASPHDTRDTDNRDREPGEEREGAGGGLTGYMVGFALAVLLTAASFGFAGSSFVWGPAIPTLLIVLAIAQMGVHLVFFLHITTGPDNANNVLALAFGVLVVFLVVFGSLWIMTHLNHHMLPHERLMEHMR